MPPVRLDIGELIDGGGSSPYQKWVVGLAALAILLEGFANHALALAIPALMVEWGATRGSFAPVIAIGLIGMVIGAALGATMPDAVSLIAELTPAGQRSFTISLAGLPLGPAGNPAALLALSMAMVLAGLAPMRRHVPAVTPACASGMPRGWRPGRAERGAAVVCLPNLSDNRARSHPVRAQVLTKTRARKSPRSVTTVERVVQEIRRGIKQGRFVPGQRLIEADLTRALGVSRGPLREAMSRLAGDGLVTIEPNRGATVRALTRAEVRSIATIREVLEGLAARLAAAHIDAGDNRAQFKRVWAEMASDKARANTTHYVEANERFHTTIMQMSGNLPLAQLLEQLRTPLYRFQFRSRLVGEALARGYEDHAQVAEAILAGDPERAERAMRRHLRNSARLVDSLPDDAYG